MLKTISGQKSLLRNLCTSLLLNKKIKTTLTKTKKIKSYAEKIITKAKNKDLASWRLVLSEIKNKEALKKLKEVIVPRYENRNGGYIQILKLTPRQGDSAEMAIVKLVQ